MTEINTLADALPREMARVRDEILPVYDSVPHGGFAAAMMRRDLDRAAKAMTAGDVVEMLRAYQALKDYGL